MRTIHNLNKLKPLRQKLRRKMTEPEWRLWYKIRNSQLGYKFRRQHSIGSYIADFYCPKKKLIIEIDGGQHNKNETIKYDSERTRYLNGLGMMIFRVWNNDIMQNLDGVVEELLKYTDND